MTTTDTQNTAQPKRGAWQLYAILLVTFVPLVSAYIAYYTGLGVPETTVNNGYLLQPAMDIKPLFAAAADGETPNFKDNKQWRILIPVASSCNAACVNNLYVTRQVHVRLGEKAERVERIAVPVNGEEAAEYLKNIAVEYPRLQVVNIPASIWQNWWSGASVPAQNLSEHFYFLVDPQGFAMLLYNENNDGNQLLKDIKRVLRYSPDN